MKLFLKDAVQIALLGSTDVDRNDDWCVVVATGPHVCLANSRNQNRYIFPWDSRKWISKLSMQHRIGVATRKRHKSAAPAPDVATGGSWWEDRETQLRYRAPAAPSRSLSNSFPN
jgi:hypothetical protein